MKTLAVTFAGLSFLLISGAPSGGQSAVPPPEYAAPTRSPAELEQLAGPIALYPDPLIAEILPAATFPDQIVMADRYISEGGDPNLVEQQPWDPSVQAVAHYANVLKWLDDNLPWTTQLGQAFQSQQADLMDAIQRLRARAQSLGNLPSTPQENVVSDNGDIEIEPTEPDQMYVPTYQPDQIFYQPGVYCAFGFALPLGVWLGYDWDWHRHGIIHWGPGFVRPNDWWRFSPAQRHDFIVGHPHPFWHGGERATARVVGWERGYEAPHGPAPLVVNVRPAPIGRQPAVLQEHREPIRSEPVRSAPIIHSEPSRGSFVGGQSGREAVESSSRGQASRATIIGGGGGGGGGGHAVSEPHGFGGGGGEGGGRHR
jgi:hypothetical protein